MQKQSKGVRFLIVEHDLFERSRIEKILGDTGLGESTAVATVAEALEALDPGTVDIVICSWDLPGQATGLSLLKLVRGEDRLSHLGFILLSSPSEDEPDKVRSARSSHVDGYLLKPVNETALGALLADVASRFCMDP